MLYLWIFGNNVEHRFGHVLWYFICFPGWLDQWPIAVNPNGVIPNLGASGAIAGNGGPCSVSSKQSQRGLFCDHHFSPFSGVGYVGSMQTIQPSWTWQPAWWFANFHRLQRGDGGSVGWVKQTFAQRLPKLPIERRLCRPTIAGASQFK